MQHELIVFYDGACPLCSEAKKLIQKRDRRGRLEWKSMRDPRVQDQYGLGDDAAEKIYSLRIRDNKQFKGIHTVYQVMKRTPVYRVFAPYVKMSILLGFGPFVYRLISKNRFHFIPAGLCADEACTVHPEKNK